MNNVKKLFMYMKPQNRFFYLSIALLILNIVLGMVNPYLQRLFVDKVLLKKDTTLLIKLVGLMISLSLITSLFNYLFTLLVEFSSQKTVSSIRQELYRHLQELSFSFYDKARTGELMSRLTGDLEGIRVFIPGGFLQFINSIVTFLIALIILFTINYKLTLLSLCLSPFLIYISSIFNKKLRSAFKDIRQEYAVLNTTIQENITGIKVVKAFVQELSEINRFKSVNKENMAKNIKVGYISGKYAPIMWFIGDISFVILIWFGGFLVQQHEMSLGELVQFNGYLWAMIWPLRALPNILNMFEQANTSGERIFGLLNQKPQIKNPENPVTVDKIYGNIVFENVSMKYDGEYVLKNINLSVEKGKKLAIMGATGAGKTSLVNLIGRYYDATEGKIKIDGIDIKQIDLYKLRSSIGIVMQETFLFSDTIKNNIAFGKPDATMDEIIEAAKAAEAHDFILEMPNGYNTIVGERGVGLSGGQKQRISLARAILKEPSILILDDATSSVDMETESLIQENIKNIAYGKTTFIIAHRISSVKDADEIIVLDNGYIVERGTHKELLKRKGIYYHNFREQYRTMMGEKAMDDLLQEVNA
ncbi:ABC transporter ATP-binding protein [Thermoanaerobacterium thermosaccharolyticum]|uniref:ABC-type multidrug transport system, ATPase and permease component n=1 Tax=Thermoanaerobacterium thermosaccharolyticum M0795 TaxID=698948 RepID=L0IQ42_THETR|nr:ABC transporter ATP-binding protein [Thermoanaerobacterium thermosaccharolyticum]AGB20122.1 ABC-type multidrug transport system, ATPase and permease component [Thermoanaerobacterium thermosaccharolyticum M0795]